MMSENPIHVQIQKLCAMLRIGELTDAPEAVSGGFLHRMYSITTSQGKYAIKALNPQIMQRPEAMQNFIRSERIAVRAASHVPALPAIQIDGVSIHEIDDQFYLVFPWVEGKCLRPSEVETVHCGQIGAILADIHAADFTALGVLQANSHIAIIDWDAYARMGQENQAAWVDQLLPIRDSLYAWNALAHHAEQFLAGDQVISHRDLDPKNVMWHLDKPMLIDWESAGSINPMQDLVETALYWSEDEQGSIDKNRFIVFIQSYKQKTEVVQTAWRKVLDYGYTGKLGWLEYNLKRSLNIACSDEEEQKMGTAQVIETIQALCRYADGIPEIERWLREH